LYDGKIIKSGDKKLANYIEKNGFKKIISNYKNKK
jgi:Fe-S cluster assembly ATPase SufC